MLNKQLHSKRTWCVKLSRVSYLETIQQKRAAGRGAGAVDDWQASGSMAAAAAELSPSLVERQMVNKQKEAEACDVPYKRFKN